MWSLAMRSYCQFADIIPLFQHQPRLFVDLCGTPFTNNLTKYNSVPPLEALPGYKRWPVKTPYSPLLGVLTRITLIDSKKLPVNHVSTLTSPKMSLISFSFSMNYLLLCHLPNLPIPTNHQSTHKIYFPFPGRSMNRNTGNITIPDSKVYYKTLVIKKHMVF